MLYLFAFERLGIVVSDIWFDDPNASPGQEGPERGVRLELRLVDRSEGGGSVYASQPIVVDRPLWRVDLLETVSEPGSLNRAHHHPRMRGWEPGRRQFDEVLSADPVAWLERWLADPAELALRAADEGYEPGADELEEIRRAAPEIVAAARRLLGGVSDGWAARAPAPTPAGERVLVRTGWL